ncbi:MAG: Mammalian cell entry related domain protein [Elusimicrobia bacterium]|nr:MAG: Mammalian cell entry related domain protein [Elusimicrobiota bacterium]KAF0156042.1 MAG: Mammalian cell entry related domain protein [Elusimicrobiota bacterium]
MNDESKVGMFVLAGLALLGTAIFLLGDYSFRIYYPVYAEFADVSGLPDKSVVKLSGVEIGRVKEIGIKGDKVIVRLSVSEGVKIYRDARFKVGSTSVIGSKYMQIDQGTPSAGVIGSGDTVRGDDALPLDRALSAAISDLQSLIKELRGDGSLPNNLSQTVANLRDLTANLNSLVANTRPDAEKFMGNLDSVSARLDRLLSQGEELLGSVNRGEGTVGALMKDEGMKKDVSDAVVNLRDATASVKDVLGRITGFKMYWHWKWKYDPVFEGSHNDVGLRVYPREGRYYHIGAANVINTKDQDRGGADYEKINTVDALLGWELGRSDLYVGALRGSAGAGARYKALSLGKSGGVEAYAEASEFSRNRVIKGRFFDKPRLDAGVDLRLNKNFSAGVAVTDIAEVSRVNYHTRILFEDEDISYLFGLISVGGTGVKGR